MTVKSQTCAATAAQVVLRPFQKASSLEGGFSPLQLHVGDVPLEEQQVHLLMHTTANGSVCKNRLYQWGGSKKRLVQGGVIKDNSVATNRRVYGWVDLTEHGANGG